MKKSNPSNRPGQGMIKHIAIGAMFALVISLLLSVILTVLVEKGYISMNGISIPIYICHTISVFSGATVAIRMEKGRTAVVSGIVAVVYWLILICVNMLILTDGIEGIANCCIAVLAGFAIAIGANCRVGVKRKYAIKMRSR